MNPSIQVYDHDHTIQAVLQLPTVRGAPIQVHALVPLASVAPYVRQILGTHVGYSIGASKFRKIVKKAAKKVAHNKVLRAAAKVVKNPLVKAVVPIHAQAALKATHAAVKLVRN